MVGRNITSDSTKRQVELNRWEYSYKMNTLFMMQFVFIALNIMIVFMSLYKYGFFKLPFVVFVYIVILVIIVFVGVIRDKALNHDDRYWTKINFPNDGKIVSNISPDAVANMASQQQAECGPAGSGGSMGSGGPTGSGGSMGSGGLMGSGGPTGIAPSGTTGTQWSSYYNMYQNLNSLYGATGTSNYASSNYPAWLQYLGFGI